MATGGFLLLLVVIAQSAVALRRGLPLEEEREACDRARLTGREILTFLPQQGRLFPFLFAN